MIRSLERRLGWQKRWVANKAEATLYISYLRAELQRQEARAERERNPDQWSLPAAEVQIWQLRRLGVEVELPLSRREAHELLEGNPRGSQSHPGEAVR